ncbi:hypothetical protein [Streptomyces sp. NPDC059092]|uniref:hypothetical protein n=1 Tax=Streptomyces sp. NPDC059092 TaxID=3346725 RepID=UPI0036A22178
MTMANGASSTPETVAPDTNRTSTATSPPNTPSRRYRDLITLICVTGALLTTAAVSLPVIIAMWRQEPWIMGIFEQHFAVVIGLPSSALLSFILVVLLEARFDRVEMKFFGIVEFKGASGPIVLWGFCFLLMASAIVMLW